MYEEYESLKTVTCSDKGIRLPYIDSKANPLFKKYGYHTGVDIYGAGAYSISSGVVVAIGSSEKTYTVTIQYDTNTIIRYGNLISVDVNIRDIVQPLSKIGDVKQYVHFETAIKSNYAQNNPIRVGSETYYICNPMSVL